MAKTRSSSGRESATGTPEETAGATVKTPARATKKAGAGRNPGPGKAAPKRTGPEAQVETRQAKSSAAPESKTAKPAPKKSRSAPAAETSPKAERRTTTSSRGTAGNGEDAKKAGEAAAPKPAAGKRNARSATKANAASVASEPASAAASTDKSPSRKTAAKSGAAKKSAPSGKTSGEKKSAAQPAASVEQPAPKPKPARKSEAQPASARTPKSKAATKAKSVAAGGAGARPWLKSYPEGIPTEIGPFRHSSLADMLLEACRNFGGRPAFTSMGKALTFTELEKASRDFAAYLQSKGLKKGARVAIMMPNLLQYPLVMMAVLRAGYVVVNVNPLYTARELEHQLKDSGAEAIVILENFAGTLQAAIGKTDVKHVIVATMGDMLGLKGHIVNLVVRRVKKLVPSWDIPGHAFFRQAMREGAAARFSPPEVSLDDTAFLQYTGGTTGIAKGAVLLHRNVLANVMQNEIWLKTAYLGGRRQPERPIFVCVLPLYHIYAMTVNAMTGILLGAHNILIANPRDIPAMAKELGKYEFNVFVGLNTLFNALLNNSDFQKLNFQHLDFTLGGGMAVQRSVADRWKKLTGHTISEGYGLSETSPVATINRLDRDEFTGTIGLPLPSTEVAIRDEKGRDVKLGEVGEICIRGPQVMPGYWNQPQETAKVMMPDGFLKTGDMGTMDETGHVRIVDRKKDMILVSGFNVYPNEIEDVLAHHPGVLEVAAIGVPDEHSGEVPKVFVVKKDPSLTEKDIIAYCRENLTGYKRPRHVEFRTALPKTNVGKILRRELR